MRLTGWILDLYPTPQGMTLWLIDSDGNRRCLTEPFAPVFYVHAGASRLRKLEEAIARRAHGLTCRHTEREDIWERRTLEVLEIAVTQPTATRFWTRWVRRFDSHLRLYNSDLMPAALYCWERRVFPLARVEVEAGDEGCVRTIECLDDEWALDLTPPPLRILRVRLEGLAGVDPKHGGRTAIEVEYDGDCQVIDGNEEPAAVTFYHLLRRHDPDLILSEWGDSAILPQLARQARQLKLDLPLNRDPRMQPRFSRGRSYMSYGRILFKDSATTLFGRLHVDTRNSFIADQCDLAGLWELVRVTRLPVQYAARTSTGTGISYMQMELAWRDGVLIPEQKAEPEDLKSPDELLIADRGGLVFLPKLGFHENVAELDFVSEYPSIMARFNISPETVNCGCCPDAPVVPELGYRVCQKRRGITSRVVERLIRKKDEFKRLQKASTGEVARSYRLRREALKWLLVCCFGYTGYRNARFGKIEAHEAINAVARETLLVAKEMAEARGFEVLHALVDSIYIRHPRATREDYERLAVAIENQTKLPLALEALYRFVVFLPSRQFEDVPVPNRFFAVSEDGELKVRGLEERRHDTPPFIARMQREALAILAEAHDFESYCAKLEEAREVLVRYEERLEAGKVAVEDLVIRKRLTRPPEQYTRAAHTAIAAQQLAGRGTPIRPGETVEYILTDVRNAVPNDRVRAYAVWEGWHGYDRRRYRELLRDAFSPFELAVEGARQLQVRGATCSRSG